MREIKFRAWDKRLRHDTGKGRMYKVVALTSYSVDVDEAIDEDGSITLYDAYELMQFTGLKDKNGKEIYEGDIINILGPVEKGMCWEVLWHKNSWHLKLHGHSSIKRYIIPIYIGEWDEVIGNIYENKELLDEPIR